MCALAPLLSLIPPDELPKQLELIGREVLTRL
jgi:hypothetical protein